MAFTGNFMPSTFKQELLKGIHNFTTSTGNTFKIALYNSTAAFTAATTAYTATNEIATGGGYTQPGLALTIPASMPSLTTTTAWTGTARDAEPVRASVGGRPRPSPMRQAR